MVADKQVLAYWRNAHENARKRFQRSAGRDYYYYYDMNFRSSVPPFVFFVWGGSDEQGFTSDLPCRCGRASGKCLRKLCAGGRNQKMEVSSIERDAIAYMCLVVGKAIF